MSSVPAEQPSNPSRNGSNGFPATHADIIPLPIVADDLLAAPTVEEGEDVPPIAVPTGSLDIAVWLRRADQWLLGGLLVALVILLAAMRWKLSGGFRTEIEITSQHPREYFYAIDINRASWVEWAQLEGIGEKLARRIVQERQEHGPFTTVDDLGRVRGVGPKLIERLRPYLTVRDSTAVPSSAEPVTAPPEVAR